MAGTAGQNGTLRGTVPDAPPPFPQLADPTGTQLKREYVAGGGWGWYGGRTARMLPNAIDDISSDFGDDIYERMLLDPQVSACVTVYKASILETGPNITSVVTDKDDPEFDLAKEITDQCIRMLADMETSFSDVLWNMLDSAAVGNKVAEKIYATTAAIKGGREILNLQKLKVKARRTTLYAVDNYLNMVGLLVAMPPNAEPVPGTTYFVDGNTRYGLLSPKKFLISCFRPKDSDPRGTALDPLTPIPTPDGWRVMDDLQPGDKVFDEQGRIRYVTGRRDWEDRRCYEFTFRGGEKIIADENHQWVTNLAWERYAGRPTKVRTSREIVRTLRDSRGLANHSVPWALPLDYPEQLLPVAPYFLGLWLGDGTSTGASISCHVQDLEETVALIEEYGYSTRVAQNGPRGGLGRHISVGGNKRWDSTGPTHGLRFIHVSGQRSENKHIPPVYMRGSITQRRDLLAGLMDSDGTVDRDGRCEFSNTNLQLVEGVAELARSLGVPAGVRLHHKAHVGNDGRSRKTSWGAFFTPPWSPFRLSRKTAKTINARAQRQHYIIDARQVPNRRTVCIETDGPSHLYLAGRSMIPTHNSIIRPAYTPWWRKQQIIPEYLRYLSQFAGPSLIGVAAPDADPIPDPNNPGQTISQTQAMLAALELFRNMSAIAVANGAEVHPINMQGDGAAFRSGMGDANEEITKAILTQQLATDEGKHMARAAATVHQDVLDTLVRQGKLSEQDMIRNQMFRPWVILNWGQKVAHLAPIADLGATEQRDKPGLWQGAAALANAKYFTEDQLQSLDAMLGLPIRQKLTALAFTAVKAQMQKSAGNTAPGTQPGSPPDPSQQDQTPPDPNRVPVRPHDRAKPQPKPSQPDNVKEKQPA